MCPLTLFQGGIADMQWKELSYNVSINPLTEKLAEVQWKGLSLNVFINPLTEKYSTSTVERD